MSNCRSVKNKLINTNAFMESKRNFVANIYVKWGTR
jgi:hypothetical protein